MRAALSTLVALSLLIAGAARAENSRFGIFLGAREIGSVTHSDTSLLSQTVNTPLGAADGKFDAKLTRSGGATQFHSYSSGDDRTVDISWRGNQPVAVEVAPASERSNLSDPAAVRGPVLDPVRGFGALLRVSSCPSGVRIYDGRRLSQVSTAQASPEEFDLLCKGDYRVVAGPKHMRPLGIGRVQIELGYRQSGGAYRLGRMVLRSGPFAVSVLRQ